MERGAGFDVSHCSNMSQHEMAMIRGPQTECLVKFHRFSGLGPQGTAPTDPQTPTVFDANRFSMIMGWEMDRFEDPANIH